MILTAEQLEALQRGEPVPITIGQTECVIVRKDRFPRVRSAYDDSEWSDEEMASLAEQMFEDLDRHPS
jgi:hypothetical protein